MSKKTTFLALLESAQSQTGDARFTALAVATDCAKEMEESEWPNVKLLVYVLMFMLKHRIFPKITTKTVNSTKYKQPFDKEAARAEFFHQVATWHGFDGSLDYALTRHMREARAQWRRTAKKETVTTRNTTFSVKSYSIVQCDALPEGYIPVVYHRRSSLTYHSWEELLTGLMKEMAFFYEVFVV